MLATVGPFQYVATCTLIANSTYGTALKAVGATSRDLRGMVMRTNNDLGSVTQAPLIVSGQTGTGVVVQVDSTITSGSTMPARAYTSPLVLTWTGGTQTFDVVITAIGNAGCQIAGTVTPAS